MAKRLTARDIVQKALVKCNAIASDEVPDDAEISDGLDELNGILDTFNQEGLFSYTYKRIKYTPTSEDITIGDEGANRYQTIVNNGYKNTIDLYEADYTLDDIEIAITDIEDTPVLVKAYGSETQYLTPTTVLPALDDSTGVLAVQYYNWIVSGGVDYFQPFLINGTAGYAVGDVICVGDGYNFSLIGTVNTIHDSNRLNIAVQEEIGTSLGNSFFPCTLYPYASGDVQEYSNIEGYIYDSTLDAPDIVAPRPYDIVSVIDLGQRVSLGKIEQHDFIKNQSGLTYSRYFTYFTENPYGVLSFAGGVPGEIEIRYNKLNAQLDLDDELNLPAGYQSALVYEVSRLLASEYGQTDVAALTREANLRMGRIFKRNFKMQRSPMPCVYSRSQRNRGII